MITKSVAAGRRSARPVFNALILGLATGVFVTGCERSTPASIVSPAAAATPAAFSPEEVGVAELQRRLTSGRLTSRALTQAYLQRIAKLDDAGPRLNAVIELNSRALQEAATLDVERRAGRLRGPLHGIPVLLKDNIDATPMVNSAGSLALAEHRPQTDAFLVQRLRDAGAVILGKTNLSEWANFRSTHSTSGWSGRGGQTKNAYALNRNACGSSSGTGSAITASLAAVGVGTETDGSIICPSAVNGLVGIKPTVGLVSRSGIIPISHTQDTAGPMARSVADAAVLLGAMAGEDSEDPATTGVSARLPIDYTTHLQAGALQGARIGLLRESMGFHPDVDASMERAVAAMRQAGATIIDVKIANAGDWNDAEQEVLLFEFHTDLELYLSRSRAPHGTLAELIEFNRANADAEMPWFAQELFEQSQAKGPLTDPAYLKARDDARRLARTEGLLASLDANKLDALLAPATGPAWSIDLVNGDHFLGAGYGVAAVAGTPSITVPMGDSHGLPVGLVFMGRDWSEPRLIELAFAYEQLSRARKPPQFRASIGTMSVPDNDAAAP